MKQLHEISERVGADYDISAQNNLTVCATIWRQYFDDMLRHAVVVNVCTQVQIYDQIIFESVKSPGQYFHASAPWKIDNFSIGRVTSSSLPAALKLLYWITYCEATYCHYQLLLSWSTAYVRHVERPLIADKQTIPMDW